VCKIATRIEEARHMLSEAGWSSKPVKSRGAERSCELTSPAGLAVVVAGNVGSEGAFSKSVLVTYNAGDRYPAYATILEEDLCALGLFNAVKGAALKAAAELNPLVVNQAAPMIGPRVGFMPAWQKVLDELSARRWTIDADENRDGDYYGAFEDFDGFRDDSVVMRWRLRSHNRFGLDVYFCAEINCVHIDFEKPNDILVLFHGCVEEVELTSEQLLDYCFEGARKSAAAHT